jgi:hypothetical protein
VNTGASTAIALFAPFMHDHPRIERRLSEVSFGRFRLRNIVGKLPTQSDATFDAPYVGGDIGGAIWKPFTMTLDFQSSKMTLARSDALPM